MVQALNSDGNTAICLIASSSAEYLVPSGGQTPSFWQVNKKYHRFSSFNELTLLFILVLLGSQETFYNEDDDEVPNPIFNPLLDRKRMLLSAGGWPMTT